MNTGDGVIPSVHIQLLKEYVPRQDPRVNRVTLVLEPDSVEDSLDNQYAEAKVRGSIVDENRARGIASWEADFSDIVRARVDSLETVPNGHGRPCPNSPETLQHPSVSG